MRNRNRYTRKRYWRIRKNAVHGGRSAKQWKTGSNRKYRARVRNAMAHMSCEDDWDIPVNPRVEPWPDYPEGGWVQNYISYRTNKLNPTCPNLTTEEVRRLRPKFLHRWKENEKSNGRIPWDYTREYVDFEKLYAWLLQNYCNSKFNILEQELKNSRHWKTYWKYSLTEDWEKAYQLRAFRFPPASLLRQWLKKHKQAVASAAHALGYWYYTNDRILSLPIEDRE